ncbi:MULTISPECIES: hypothetical protein [unclassified Lysinibacillus]|uniref:hypothetical protein n=1 Tax=unclassified Lysinibacillus TaxID=2636778 RepID=UPI0020116A97|nr:MULTISPECIES: hypothetical protein [unclassified Lysinibacillus]MCL1698161.1 hypothetical protein [Lysinibacillus sp. BPa_S21]MCL1702553.1 hypothetical protein [Lysinibacillus sp. Bpr_S20]
MLKRVGRNKKPIFTKERLNQYRLNKVTEKIHAKYKIKFEGGCQTKVESTQAN